jgi:hypothetical protein
MEPEEYNFNRAEDDNFSVSEKATRRDLKPVPKGNTRTPKGKAKFPWSRDKKLPADVKGLPSRNTEAVMKGVIAKLINSRMYPGSAGPVGAAKLKQFILEKDN